MKFPLAMRMSKLAWPLAGLVNATALLLAWLVCPMTVPVWPGVGVGVGCVLGVGVGCVLGVGVGFPPAWAVRLAIPSPLESQRAELSLLRKACLLSPGQAVSPALHPLLARCRLLTRSVQ
jgi:hypothetical protein